MRQDDRDYFRFRALQEQAAAQESKNVAARRCHDQLASIYRFKAWMLSDPLHGPWLGGTAPQARLEVRQSARMAGA